MTLNLNEVAPWERKNEYYHNIKLGSEISKQTQALNKQTKTLISSQLESTNSIIASQERISEGLGSLIDGLSDIVQSIYELKATFEWGISEVVWQLEQNRIVLKNILEILMAPLDNQAKERRKRAEDAYSNGWIDDAEEEFLESERLNKFDFSIHISLGMIYLFCKINKTLALSYFEKAARYARPRSAYHTSFALLYEALINFDFGEIKVAEMYSSEAISISPDFLEAYYQNAQYNAQLKNHKKSISNLEFIISQDKVYCLKVNQDSLFDPIRSYVNQLFEELREKEKIKAIQAYDELIIKHSKIISFIKDYSSKINLQDRENNSFEINQELNELNTRINRNSYFDFLDINNIYIPQLQDKQKHLYIVVEKSIMKNIYDAEKIKTNIQNKVKSAHNTHQSNKSKYLNKTGKAILIGSFIVPAVITLLFADGWDKFFTLIFCIPYVSQFVSLFLIYFMIFHYPEFSKDELYFIILGWSNIIYLVLSIGYYFISVVNSKSKSNVKKLELEMSKKEEENIKKRISPILDEFQKL